MADKHKKVTSAEDWKREYIEGEWVELPSGKTVRLRKVSLVALAKRGRIPSELAGLIARLQREDPEDLLKDEKTIMANLQRSGQLYDTILMASMLEPRVVEKDPGKGEIAVDMVCEEDADYIYDWVTAPVRALEPFRPQRDGDVEPGGDSGAVRPEA